MSAFLRHPQGPLALRAAFGLFLVWPLWDVFLWAGPRATWEADTAAACDPGGACRAYIGVWWDRFVYGDYPEDARWRVHAVVAALGLAAVVGYAPRTRLTYRTGLVCAALA